MELSGEKIRSKALETGFTFCGFARAGILEKERGFFKTYLDQKRNAGLHYLERDPHKRTDPAQVYEGTKTVIGLLLNYFPRTVIPDEDNFIISKYAYGKDYHDVLTEKTTAVIRFLKEEYGEIRARAFVDRGPVLEKAWGELCGLGWRGKNTLLINPDNGSFHFIAIILTDLEILPDTPGTDRCGTCTRCLDACPAGALEKPYELNPSRCIAYLTIDEKNPFTREQVSTLNNRIYGCDICQDVCPYNRFAKPHTVEAFLPKPQMTNYLKKNWLALTPDEFDELFTGSAVHRIGYEKMMSNIGFAAMSGKG
jgi:epoxyqueuosine reductase